MFYTQVLIFLFFCLFNTGAISKTEFLNGKKEGKYQVNITDAFNCNPNPPPNSPVILRNVSLVTKNGVNLISYEFDIVGDMKNVKINIKTGYSNGDKLVPVFNFSNLGCRSSIAVAILRFLPLEFKGNDCSCKKGSFKGTINMNDIYHKIMSVIWYGEGNFRMELLTKKNGVMFFCLEGWGSVYPILKS